MLMHLENARSGLIQGLLEGNPNIQRALQRLRSDEPTCPTAGSQNLLLEGEYGVGDGVIHQRSAASAQAVVWLHAGAARTMTLETPGCGALMVQLRYSNDNLDTAPGETVTVELDGMPVGVFVAEDTGGGGLGWNQFTSSGWLGPVRVKAGVHQLRVSLSGGDGYGWELDAAAVVSPDNRPIPLEILPSRGGWRAIPQGDPAPR